MGEELWIRCPRLGGEVPFSYCLQEGGDLPCPRAVACWQPYFPIETSLRKRLGPDRWEQWLARKPRDKIASLIEILGEANVNTSQ